MKCQKTKFEWLPLVTKNTQKNENQNLGYIKSLDEQLCTVDSRYLEIQGAL